MSTVRSIGRAPDSRVGPLALWVHGYECDESGEYYDANWLRATAHCGSMGASVECTGSFLMITDLDRWCGQLEHMHETLSGVANLEPLEPDLAVRLTSMSKGQIEGVVEITPNPATQSHAFRFELDQSFLPSIISQLRGVLEDWPVRLRP